MMAGVCFLILVAISVGHVLAESRNCSEAVTVTSCDECIRCGGKWCLDSEQMPRCSYNDNDNGCSNVLRIHQTEDSGPDDKHINQFIQATIPETIQYPESYDDPKITFVNSSVTSVTKDDDRIQIDTTESMYIALSSDFCPAHSRMKEYLTLKLEDKKWGDAKTRLITLTVPCACSCSFEAEVKSKLCNERGNFSCNICICEQGWKGKACEQKDLTPVFGGIGGTGVIGGTIGGIGVSGGIGGTGGTKGTGGTGGSGGIQDGYTNDRGDLPECENQYGIICSNNGKCKGGKCICDMSLEGSQYFDEQCMDICLSISSYYDTCITQPPVRGPCQYHKNIYVDDLNRTRLSSEKESSGKRSWVNCTEKTDSCEIKYAAMKDSEGKIHVMFLDLCNVIPSAVHATLNLAWPVSLAVIGVILAASAVAGFMLWKNRAPPLPLNDPGYGKIDAEDCTGMNPLYKPPTSSFKNPTYGKW